MRILHGLVAVGVLSVQTIAIAAQSTTSTPPTGSGPSYKSNLRKQLLSSIPPGMYEKWRKYGQWDYNQIGFSNRDFTQFNFGATGAAAKIDKASLLALIQAFKPDPDDLQSLANPDLETNYRHHTDEFEKLLTMVLQDGRLNRVASDFTWLDGNTKWPRDDVGFNSSRWDEYRSLFKILSLTEGIVRTQDFPGAIFFVARSDGLCTGGSGAGYVYSTSQLAPTSSSPLKALDFEARTNAGKHYAYVFKPIKENWYTFYEVDW